MLRFTFSALVVAALFVTAGVRAQDATNKFGFAGPEIFPVENLITQLKCADIDGDGNNDLLVVNNARSKITILYNQTGKTNDPALLKEREKRDINDLPPDARFRIVYGRAAADLTALKRNNPQSHLLLGVAYANAGLIEDAKREFEILLRHNPNSEVAKKLLRQMLQVK